MPINDLYVVHHGNEDGAATFGLYDTDHDQQYDRPRAMGQIAVSPEALPAEFDIGDHFWVDIDDSQQDRGINAIRFDPELTENKSSEYRVAEGVFREMQEWGRQKLREDETVSNTVETSDSGTWMFSTLDVGHANARVLTSQDTTVLIDVAEDRIVSALDPVMDELETDDETDRRTIDYFIATHLHPDHVAGIQSLYDEGYEIQRAYLPNTARCELGIEGGVMKDVFNEYIAALSAHGIAPRDIEQVATGDVIFREGEASLDVLAPPATERALEFEHPTTEDACEFHLGNVNANGMVCMFDTSNSSILFMGDVRDRGGTRAESWLVSKHHDEESDVDLDASVLCPGLHGSEHAMRPPFLDVVNPEQVFFSA